VDPFGKVVFPYGENYFGEFSMLVIKTWRRTGEIYETSPIIMESYDMSKVASGA
jgi:hypothetical protein